MDASVTGLGWDQGGCPPLSNPHYLGPPIDAFHSAVYVSNGGFLFSLFSADIAFPGGGGDMLITSSNGGSIDVSGTGSVPVFPDLPAVTHKIVDLTGPEWTDIRWALFTAPDAGFPVEGLLNLAGVVPEPATLALLGIGLAGLGFKGRKRAGSLRT